MARPLTADDIVPLVERLTAQERLRLIRLITVSAEGNAVAYQAAPPARDGFSTDDEPPAWEAEGWVGVRTAKSFMSSGPDRRQE